MRRPAFAILVVLVSAAFVLLSQKRLPAVGTTITIGATSGQRGAQVSFAVTYQAAGTGSATATQNDIGFDSTNTPIIPNPSTGAPMCTPSQTIVDLNKTVTFAFLPSGCTGATCQTVRALIEDNNGSLLPTGATLYTCTVRIATTAATGIYPLTASTVQGSTAGGSPLIVTGINGQVTVT
jgi:hypothetical protein